MRGHWRGLHNRQFFFFFSKILRKNISLRSIRQYITCILEGNSNSIFRLWDIQKYKEVTEFIKKFCVCDMDVISQDDLITYEYLVKEATQEYRNLVDSKRWEPATRKKSLQTNLHF